MQVKTFLKGNKPAEVPFLGIAFRDLFFSLFFCAILVAVLGIIGVAIAGFTGWLVSLFLTGIFFLGTVLFVKENWKTVFPREREVLPSLLVYFSSAKVLKVLDTRR